jgi:hypothetical protein
MKIKILIAVKTYPNPSKNYIETVCTAGLDEDKNWIRIYPIKFRSRPLEEQYKKFHWIEVDIEKTKRRDFRPESYHLIDLDKEIKILEHVTSYDVKKEYILNNVYDSLDDLLRDSQKPKNISLATYKPSSIVSTGYEPCKRDWNKEEQERCRQLNLFDSNPPTPLKKMPYNFKYTFKDINGSEHTMSILDWEIGALYWNCLKSSKSEEEACQKVINKLEDIANNKDIYFILGTTLEHHQRRLPNPFTIVGLFYPPFDDQLTIF